MGTIEFIAERDEWKRRAEIRRLAAEKALSTLKQAADKVRREGDANLMPRNAAKAKELLEQECRVTEEMLQRRVTV